MKTIFFCNLIPDKMGAFERLLGELSCRFRANGDTLVLVFSGEPKAEVASLLSEQGARWHTIPGWSDGGGREHPWAFVKPALVLLRRERPDVAVIHFGNEIPSLVTSLICPLIGIRNLKWVWQQDQQIRDPSLLTGRISRLQLLAWRFDHFVAVYDGGRRSLIQRNVPDHRVSVIYNSIRDHQRSRPAGWLRREMGIPDNGVIMVSTGWMVRRKRIDFILQAFSALPGNCCGSGVYLLLIGDGPERIGLETLAQELGVSERNRFLGVRNDVREILAEADLLVHASIAETCTYAVTESMAAGIPAVLTEAGAAREQVLDGETGYVLGRDDLSGFVERVTQLVSDAPLRCRMGLAARVRWEQRYRVEMAATQYHALYRSLCDEGRSGGERGAEGVACGGVRGVGLWDCGRKRGEQESVPIVVHVVTSLAYGGLERLVTDWTNIRNRRYPGSTIICCLDELGALASQVEGDAVSCVEADRSRFPYDVTAVRRIRKIVAGAKCNVTSDDMESREGSRRVVLHAHNLAAWQYALIAKIGTGTKLVYTQHGANVHNQGFKDRVRSKVLSWWTDGLAAVSESVAEAIHRWHWISRCKFVIIPNGVDVERIAAAGKVEGPGTRERYGILADEFVIGSVGRLAVVKGYDRLLRAFAQLQEREHSRLLLVGDGPERGALEHEAESLGITGRVVFAGQQGDPRPFLAATDLFVLPSRSEGLSVALLEAMAAGVPVAVTDVGDSRDVVEDGKCGVVLPKDPDSWAETFSSQLSAIGGLETGRRVGAARERVSQRYSLESTLDAYEALYRQVDGSDVANKESHGG